MIANSSIQKVSSDFSNRIDASAGIVLNLLKGFFFFFENELREKSTLIKFLAKKLIEEKCQAVVNKSINAFHSNILFL